MDYLKLLENLEHDLDISNTKFETVKFFRKDIASVWVWFIVLISYYKKTNVTAEIILNTIPKITKTFYPQIKLKKSLLS